MQSLFNHCGCWIHILHSPGPLIELYLDPISPDGSGRYSSLGLHAELYCQQGLPLCVPKSLFVMRKSLEGMGEHPQSKRQSRLSHRPIMGLFVTPRRIQPSWGWRLRLSLCQTHTEKDIQLHAVTTHDLCLCETLLFACGGWETEKHLTVSDYGQTIVDLNESVTTCLDSSSILIQWFCFYEA